jgi:predicted nucleic acid-binding protein
MSNRRRDQVGVSGDEESDMGTVFQSGVPLAQPTDLHAASRPVSRIGKRLDPFCTDRSTQLRFGIRSVRYLIDTCSIGRAIADDSARMEVTGKPIGLMDALIAAQALARQLTLITHDTRDFARIPRLRVLEI